MKLALLILYFGVMVGIGLYCRKHTSGINGFVLGGRSVGPWLTAFAYGTSYFSAVVFVGYAGQFGWKYGIAATWAGIGNAILGSLLAWAVLGRRTRILTQHYNSATMPQFFGQRFQSKSLKIGASVIVFVFLIPYTASLFNGLSRLFGMAFHMDYTVCIILMGVLTGIYVIAGGYMATAINDFIQGCVMLVGICVVIAAVLNTQGGFLEALHGLAAVSDPETVNGEVPGIFASFFGPDPVNLLGVVILTSLGTWGLPQMVQKFYAIKSEDSIHKGTIISTLFAVVVAGGCYFLGGFGRLFADQVDVASEPFTKGTVIISFCFSFIHSETTEKCSETTNQMFKDILLFFYTAVHFTVFRRSFPHDVAKCRRKFACIVIAASACNLHNRKGRMYKLQCGCLHFLNPYIRKDGNAVHTPESILEMSLRHMKFFRQLGDGYFLFHICGQICFCFFCKVHLHF